MPGERLARGAFTGPPCWRTGSRDVSQFPRHGEHGVRGVTIVRVLACGQVIRKCLHRHEADRISLADQNQVATADDYVDQIIGILRLRPTWRLEKGRK